MTGVNVAGAILERVMMIDQLVIAVLLTCALGMLGLCLVIGIVEWLRRRQ